MNQLNKILRKKLPAPYILSSNLDELNNRPWREVLGELVPLVSTPCGKLMTPRPVKKSFLDN